MTKQDDRFFCVPGNLTPRHQELFYRNPLFAGVRLPEVKELDPLEKRYPRLPVAVTEFAQVPFWVLFLIGVGFSKGVLTGELCYMAGTSSGGLAVLGGHRGVGGDPRLSLQLAGSRRWSPGHT